MQLERVGPYLWRIPRDERLGMRVPGLVVADERLMEAIRSDASLEQLANGATLPGIVRASLAMPDIHQGYGLPVGGVVATDAERGVVSPGDCCGPACRRARSRHGCASSSTRCTPRSRPASALAPRSR